MRPDEDADPTRFFDEADRSGKRNWRVQQLCKQVERAAAVTLAGECDGEALLGAAVAFVEPAPDASRLMALVVLGPGKGLDDFAGARAALARSASAFREEVARTIHRKRVPEIVFDVRLSEGGAVGNVPGAAVRYWVERPLPRDVEAAIRRLANSDDVRHVAVMPDVHLAADVCVGMVVATTNALYPSAVGGDIGCGVAAIAFDGEAALLDNERDAAAILAGLYHQVPLIRHRRKAGPRLPAALDAARLSCPRLDGLKQSEGSLQIGTLGRGNHFVELQADETGRLWLMVHSGSRGMGQAIRDHHLGQCSAGGNGLRFLSADSPAGRAYLQDMTWAVAYAEASRLAMVHAVRDVVERRLGIGADEASYVSCNHNHVRRETHFGESLWVHRKGAISAGEGEPGLIPGSMGTHSFHVEGRRCEEALASSAHGAGRRLSRAEARYRLSAKDVTRELRGVWFDHRLAPRLREEAPSAYKDIDDVLRSQRDLVRIIRTLRPVLCFKGV